MSTRQPAAPLPFALAHFSSRWDPWFQTGRPLRTRAKGAQCAAIDDPWLAWRALTRRSRARRTPPRPPRRQPSASAPAPKPAAPAAVAVKPTSDAEKFGLSNKQKTALEAKPGEPAATPAPTTTTTAGVKTVRKLPSGYLLIGLDNNQLWQQTEIDALVVLLPGDRCRSNRLRWAPSCSSRQRTTALGSGGFSSHSGETTQPQGSISTARSTSAAHYADRFRGSHAQGWRSPRATRRGARPAPRHSP